jgi:NitT/TauT family transport system substrate-binding protein
VDRVGETRRRRWRSRAAVAAGAAVALASLAACSGGSNGSANDAAATSDGQAKIVIAEPQENFSYLPLYVAQEEGYFAKHGLNVSVTTLSTSASGFVNLVLQGAVWGFLGGPEHDAYANVKGADLKSVANLVNVSNNYLVARKGIDTSKPLAQQLKGQKIAVTFYGGTPDVDLRYWLHSIGLAPGKDVTLVESDASTFLGAVNSGQVNYAVTSDPQLSQGVADGTWTKPVFDFAKWFGPYTYSTINVPEMTIKNDPTQVQNFVDAIAEADNTTINDQSVALSVAAKVFPDISAAILKSSYLRAVADHMWAANAQQTDAGFETDVRAITEVGTYTGPSIATTSIIDNEFTKDSNAG